MTRQGFLHGFRSSKAKDEWLTPPEIVRALGEFDLDPCSPVDRPWPTANRHLTVEDDGLMHEWEGSVWLNPPYGDETEAWLRRLADHGNGVALVFARTETAWFFETIWLRASAVFFFRGRVAFYHVNGEQGDSAGAPSVLVAYGENNVSAIRKSGIDGMTVQLNTANQKSIVPASKSCDKLSLSSPIKEYAGGFAPGEVCEYDGVLPIGRTVSVVKWEPEKWSDEGCDGCFTFRSGLVPVFSQKFPETKFWWVSPIQLKRKPNPS